jgi:hypothetical protein
MTVTFVPMPKRMLGDYAYDGILHAIVTGAMPAGEKIRIDDLAARWGISRTPVREALVRLARMGLVVTAPNSRTEVARWSARDMLERVQLLGAITTFAVLRARRPIVGRVGGHDGGDVQGFVSLCEAAIEQSGRLVSCAAMTDLITPPVRIFYADEMSARLGVELGAHSEARAERLTELAASLETGDPDAVSCAIGEYLTELERSHPK